MNPVQGAIAGGVCLLAAALDDTWKGAQGAFHVLWCLLDSELLPAHQVAMHEAELARLGGLRRCSALMCPPIYESDAQEFIIESHLRQPQMHLLQVAQLEFIVSLPQFYPNRDENWKARLQLQHVWLCQSRNLAGTVSGDMPSDPKLVLETCLAALRSFYLMLKKLVDAHHRHKLCHAELVYKTDECCIRASMSVAQQQLLARQQELADEVLQLEACLVHEVLLFFHKMSKDSSWASAMAAMEPDEWCWHNPPVPCAKTT
ncbi:hypothetical protein ABBQ38_009337 [Trebouxia sp. C0009 RCD-2024]